jgi:hypothetical protein
MVQHYALNKRAANRIARYLRKKGCVTVVEKHPKRGYVVQSYRFRRK